MLNAVNISFVASQSFLGNPNGANYGFFVMTLAAAEVGSGTGTSSYRI